MAPDADCERSDAEVPGVHTSRRVQPEQQLLAQAWVETEERGSPGESRRLLSPSEPPKHKSRLQAGLTLVVWGPKKHVDYTLATNKTKPKVKTKYQKRKEKLIAALRPPYFILTMIVIIAAVHVLGSKDSHAQLEWDPAEWWKEPWRLFTYGWVHANDAHLALNALVALAVGWILEREQGWWRVVCVWCGGVVGGALGAGALQPQVHVVGASAAVYALLTAHLPNVCLRFGHIPLWWFRPLSVVVLATSEACWTLMHASRASLQAHNDHRPGHLVQNHVAWSAHVFGALVGIPVAFLVFTGEKNNKSYVFWARILSALTLVAGVALAVVHYSYWHQTRHISVINELHGYYSS